MLEILFTNRMKHDLKLMQKRGKDTNKMIEIIDLLASQTAIPEKYKDHKLTGKWTDFRECHIEPDWLLIYQIFEDKLILSLTATGTHADLFKL